MPFRFSELAKRGKSVSNSGAFEEEEEATARPMTTARSSYAYSDYVSEDLNDYTSEYAYDVRDSKLKSNSSGLPQSAVSLRVGPRRPDRTDTPAPASIYYDNGTGVLHANFVRDQGLPPHVRTTAQLAEFIRMREDSSNGLEDGGAAPPASFFSTSSSSCYSSHSSSSSSNSNPPSPSQSTGPMYHHGPASRSHERIRVTAAAAAAAGILIRHHHVARPIVRVRVLPGATRTYRYQGFWLRRGTMRKTNNSETESGKKEKGGKKRAEKSRR
ncbi:hypothetical protein Z517_12034 [Fonsecaea pedrosoi CBS 271.37]|uniref:Uncharacterized protein n=1 Tax=Fonsecaea pedrosoi CBS 271.37 TaxID=1442368 RepID=A0A0D2G8W8_9EURO|nr:uncharacterized protein Z517_12034 [Fonsecaea pedrosoi CBS 271.37]KIW75260.1 hypothetical protein Z517_12034 [Fonsecaea pedrosoi CBS 271.37]